MWNESQTSQFVYIWEYNDVTGKQSLGNKLPISVAKNLIWELNKRDVACDYNIVDPQLVINKDISSQSWDNTWALQWSKKTWRDPLDPC